MDEHQHSALYALFFVFVVLVCLYCDFQIKKREIFMFPESAASMVVGFIIGGLVVWFSTGEADVVKFDGTLFFFVLLPPIVFEAGYTLDRQAFFSNIGSIFVYAVIGTSLSTIIVGYGLYMAASAGLVPLNSDNALEALMFGSLISATDPVATLTLLGSPLIGAPQLLYALVFGEAVLNDAVAIVLYKTFEGFLSTPFSNATIFYAFTKFIFISVGSIVLGVLIALFTSWVFRRAEYLKALPQMEISVLLLFAYSSYFAAETVGLSGIMSIFFCSIALAHYNFKNMTEMTQHTTHLYFKSMAQICDTFVFGYLGITIGVSISPTSGYLLTWSPSLIFISLGLCLLGRAINVFPLTAILNRIRMTPIDSRNQIMMWFAGLRGAIAFALSLQVTTEHASEIVTATLAIVLFTTFVCGGLSEPLLRKLELKNFVEPPALVAPDGLLFDAPRGVVRFWLIFDNTYMKRWFGGEINPEFSLVELTDEEKAMTAGSGHGHGHGHEEHAEEHAHAEAGGEHDDDLAAIVH